MRYRKLTATGDYQFGQQQADFWINQPEAVAQAVTTRLRLNVGDWFLDTTDGMDWKGKVLGNRTVSTRDITLRARALLTPGVNSILNYNSSFDANSRAYAASFSLDTIYGVFSGAAPNLVTPAATAQPQPPAEPVGVTVTVLSDSQAQVSWTPYSV
jgi:hypothetical protein